jgi:ligand-binding SRPBCC domain-containing protein
LSEGRTLDFSGKQVIFPETCFPDYTLGRAWDFFSSPAGLIRITPEGLRLVIVSRHHGDEVYAGQLIEYTLTPIAGIRLYWMTEITHVAPGRYFVDEQRRGPYRLWHHQHHFREIEGGIEMTDIVHYQLPLGVLGMVAHNLLVRRKLEGIFDYRRRKIEEIFGKWDGA